MMAELSPVPLGPRQSRHSDRQHRTVPMASVEVGRGISLSRGVCNSCECNEPRCIAFTAVTKTPESETSLAAFPDRRTRPMLTLSPRASASPKRHGFELRHPSGIARGRAGYPRARAPCSSTCARCADEREPLQRELLLHRPHLKGSEVMCALVGMCGVHTSLHFRMPMAVARGVDARVHHLVDGRSNGGAAVALHVGIGRGLGL